MSGFNGNEHDLFGKPQTPQEAIEAKIRKHAVSALHHHRQAEVAKTNENASAAQLHENLADKRLDEADEIAKANSVFFRFKPSHETHPITVGGTRLSWEDFKTAEAEAASEFAQAVTDARDLKNAVDVFTSNAAPTFDPDLWPTHVAEDAKRMHEATGADPNAFALATVQAMSAAIHAMTRVVCSAAGDWREPCLIWALLVGDSGVNKSAVLRHATRHGRAFEKIERGKAAEKRENWLSSLEKKPTTDERVEWEAQNGACRALAPDSTIEALQNVLARQAQRNRGLNMPIDELVIILEHLQKNSSARGLWLQAQSPKAACTTRWRSR